MFRLILDSGRGAAASRSPRPAPAVAGPRNLRTESGWVINALKGTDYSWESSYLCRDVREVVRRRPSEYFTRQVATAF